MQICLLRNITELAEVVTKAAFYFKHVFQTVLNNSTRNILEDYPNCGIRNNDTFNFNTLDGYNSPLWGNESTADWSVECLWDCAWKDNPYVGRTYQYNDTSRGYLTQVNITLSMPKVPVDLHCLTGCTDVNPPTLLDIYRAEPWDCANFKYGSFLSCYIFYSQYFGKGYRLDNGTFVSKTYFHLAVESCLLALLEPSLYPAGNCDQLGVNLRVYNPYLPSPYLFSSLPNVTRLQGPATEEVAAFAGIGGQRAPLKNRHPWLCSLRTPGYRGVHRCGVTMLSGPPKPTIFVSAAHCNHICKDDQGRPVEICCCRDPLSEFSCSTSDFCGNKSSLQLAKPQDLQIVCNLRSQEAVPQGIAYQEATVLDILQIKDHPSYVLLEQQGTVNQGPINGCDFSIYFVDDSKLAARMNPNTIWPACLPRADEDYMPGNKGILAGWSDPLPTSVSGSANLLSYTNQYYLSREALFERQPLCSDPTWMKSNTYYPPNTVCYTEAAWAGSVQFGMSGSGLVRPFTSADNQQTRYSLVGPLSLSKGSDRGVLSDYSGLVDYSSNPAIITDVRCYMDWIAEQYGLRLPPGFTIPTSCWTPSGDRNSANNTQCLSRAIRFNETSNKPERCRFTPGFVTYIRH